MSVMFFEADSLGNLASVLGGPAERDVQRYADALAVISIANANAYRVQYDERYGKVWPVTVDEIMHAARRASGDFQDAISVAQLLDYNATTNAGRRFLPDGYNEALLLICKATMRILEHRLSGRPSWSL